MSIQRRLRIGLITTLLVIGVAANVGCKAPPPDPQTAKLRATIVRFCENGRKVDAFKTRGASEACETDGVHAIKAACGERVLDALACGAKATDKTAFHACITACQTP